MCKSRFPFLYQLFIFTHMIVQILGLTKVIPDYGHGLYVSIKFWSCYNFSSYGFFDILFSIFTSLLLSVWSFSLSYYLSLHHADLPPENETSGYIFIHAEGGLNQQRIAVWMSNCNIIDRTLISFVPFQCVWLRLQPSKIMHWYFVVLWYICYENFAMVINKYVNLFKEI